MDGLRACADRPPGKEAGEAPLVEKGLVRDWLVLGPFPGADSVKEFDHDPLNGEAAVEPSSGDKAAGRTWPDSIMGVGRPAWL